MTFRRFIGPALGAFLFACSSAPTAATAPAADAGSDVAPTAQCAAAAPSKCAVPNQGSVVRGRVTFDSSHFAAGAKVSLSIALNHQFALFKNEKLSGGHPHGTVYLKDVDVSSGAVPFSIDLCELGVAMWSEENCGFNLVAILDETGDNDPNRAASRTPAKGELAGMIPLDISCHAPSPCVEIKAQCADGYSCLTYDPPATCACKMNGCASDDQICK